MTLESVIPNRILGEIKGRLRVGGQAFEDLQIKDPQPKPTPYKPPRHHLDERAALLGIDTGLELELLEKAAMRMVDENPMVHDAYVKFITMAKMFIGDELVVARHKAKQRHDAAAAVDATYRRRVQSWQRRQETKLGSWTDTRNIIRARWREVVKSLIRLVEVEPLLSNMNPRDSNLLRELNRRRNVELSGDVVRWINGQGLRDYSIEDIMEIMDVISHGPNGDFLDKPSDQ